MKYPLTSQEAFSYEIWSTALMLYFSIIFAAKLYVYGNSSSFKVQVWKIFLLLAEQLQLDEFRLQIKFLKHVCYRPYTDDQNKVFKISKFNKVYIEFSKPK